MNVLVQKWNPSCFRGAVSLQLITEVPGSWQRWKLEQLYAAISILPKQFCMFRALRNRSASFALKETDLALMAVRSIRCYPVLENSLPDPTLLKKHGSCLLSSSSLCMDCSAMLSSRSYRTTCRLSSRMLDSFLRNPGYHLYLSISQRLPPKFSRFPFPRLQQSHFPQLMTVLWWTQRP